MEKKLMDILSVIEAIITIYRFGNAMGPQWLPHWYGCQLYDHSYWHPADYTAAIELMAEELDVTVEEAETIAKAFAHGNYGL